MSVLAPIGAGMLVFFDLWSLTLLAYWGYWIIRTGWAVRSEEATQRFIPVVIRHKRWMANHPVLRLALWFERRK